MRSRYRISERDGVYFLTSTIVQWIPLFTHGRYFDILVDSLSFCKKERSLRIYAYVILDNHFHLIAKAPELSDTMAAIKKYTAREIVSLLSGQHKDWMLNLFSYYKSRHKKDSQYQIWQEGSHPQLIISPEMLEQKIEYIHYNPVKRGVVKTPEAWVYSSARNYILGDHSVLPLNDLSEL